MSQIKCSALPPVAASLFSLTCYMLHVTCMLWWADDSQGRQSEEMDERIFLEHRAFCNVQAITEDDKGLCSVHLRTINCRLKRKHVTAWITHWQGQSWMSYCFHQNPYMTNNPKYVTKLKTCFRHNFFFFFLPLFPRKVAMGFCEDKRGITGELTSIDVTLWLLLL